jgi:hypothetical protein
MHTIEVDFDVFKLLTVKRATEEVTYNDVIRELLGLAPGKVAPLEEPSQAHSGDWICKGVRFATGTEFRASYKGQIYVGGVEGGALQIRGKTFSSPSAAAMSITNSPVNGWRFWECRTPGQQTWQLMESLRR